MKTYLTTMGCPKNLVDSEASITLLRGAGCSMTEDPEHADVLIVSACSFLDAAWRETVEEAQRLGEIKARHPQKKVVMMGCLPAHRDLDLSAELPFVDRFVPAGAQSTLPAIVASWGAAGGGSAQVEAPDRFAAFENRSLLTPPHTAFVKIAEGCNRPCTFCAIPQIRGHMVSRPLESVVREVEGLKDRGVREVTLLAQDITSYASGGRRFPDLVERVAATGVDWIRIFYVHPGSLTLDLARRLFTHPSVCQYLEIPIQHASNRMLKGMRRSYTRERLQRLFGGLRREFPDLHIRSEVIVGFPGEEDEDFEALRDFLVEAEFESLGIFQYSAEPGTPAASMDQQIPDTLKRERASEIADLQEGVAFGLRAGACGRRYRVLVDRAVDGPSDGYGFAGRYYGQALEIDGEVYLRGDGLSPGSFVEAEVIDADVFDLRARVVGDRRT